jgi:hypothetical protein
VKKLHNRKNKPGKKAVTIICFLVIAIFTTVACSSESYNVRNFEIVSAIVVDASEYSIEMTASVSGEILIIEIYNASDEEFIFTSSSYLNNNYSPIRYFDGENWRIVPIRRGVNFPERDTAYFLEPGDSERISLNLAYYQVPATGQFRFQLRGSVSTAFVLE